MSEITKEEAIRICKTNDLLHVEKLLKKNKLQQYFNSIVPIVCGYGQLEMAKLLYKYGSNLKEKDNQPLGNAAKYGRINVVQYLLNKPDVDPCAQNYYGFLYACKGGFDDVIKLFLEKGVDPNIRDYMPLRLAVENAHVSTTDLLLSNKASWGVHSETLVHYCALNGSIKCLNLLINAGMDASAPVGSNIELHILAASNKFYDVAMLLVKEGYSPHSCDDKLLNWACLHGRLDIIDELEEYGECNWHNRSGCPLIWASRNGHLDIVHRCIERGISPTIKKCRPITEAINNKNKQLIEILLDNCPDNSVHPAVWENILKKKIILPEKYNYKQKHAV